MRACISELLLIQGIQGAVVSYCDHRMGAPQEKRGDERANAAPAPREVLVAGHDAPFLGIVLDRIKCWPTAKAVCCAYTERAAQAAFAEFKPALVVVESCLTEGDAFGLCAWMRRCAPATKLIFVTGAAQDWLIYRVQQSNADGLVWKIETALEELQRTMEAVWAGQRRFPPEYTRLLGALRSKPSAFFKILSKTEIGFLPFFGRDLSDDEIAGELQINPFTVRRHRYGIMQRLGLHRSGELARWSRDGGFASPAPVAPPCVFLGPEGATFGRSEIVTHSHKS